MTCLININGKVLDPEEAAISVFDRGFLYGDSIYEVTYSQRRSFIFLEEHLNRLWNSAGLIGLEPQIDKKEIVERILSTVKAANIDDAYVRVVITRGESDLNISPSQNSFEFSQNVVIFIKPNVVYDQRLYSQGIHLRQVKRPRNDRRCLDPNAKSGNYLNNILAIQEAKKAGADDAIMANTLGEITEGTTFNIWMVKDGKVFTPHHESGLLKGITRDKVMRLCVETNVPFEEKTLTPQDLMAAQELFITSSTKGIMPVYKLDDRIYAQSSEQRPLMERLRKSYIALVNEHIDKGFYSY